MTCLRLAMLVCALGLLLGCADEPPKPKSTCGGEVGQHCGCGALYCVEPCSSCCPHMPCPKVEGCAE